jgi:hypothetical protein
MATIGAFTGIIALCISIFTIRDNRRKTKIMEEQLSITSKESEKKERYGELSKDANRLSSTIKQDCQLPLLEDLWFLHEKILTHLHDTHPETLRLTIEPEKLEVRDSKDTSVTVDNAHALVRIMRTWSPDYGGGGFLRFRCTPLILDHPQDTLLVGGALSMAPDIWRGCQKLESYRDIIDALDPNILHDLDESAEEIVSAAFESLMSRRDIEFRSTDKSDQIYETLKQAFEKGSLQQEKKRLETDLCLRLANISKKMISKL